MKRTILWTAAIALLACRPAAAQVCGQPGAYATVDLLFLSPKVNDQSVQTIFYDGDNLPAAADTEGSLDSQLEFAQRFTTGYQGDQGGGVRFRWFTFDNELEYTGNWENGGPEIEILGTAELEIDSYDFEVTQSGAFRTWTLTGAAGARYAQIELSSVDINFTDIPAFNPLVFNPGVEFQGAGPTVFLEACRPIVWEGLSIFGNARTAILYGDQTQVYSGFEGGDATILINNDYLQVWEIQMGGRYLCPVTDNIDMISGIFWEAQRWETESEYLDFALHGFAAQFGLLF
jgi:hypothetical protein